MPLAGEPPRGNLKNQDVGVSPQGGERRICGREGQAFTNAVIASVMAAAAAKIERIAEIAFMALSCGSLPIEETKSRI
jgi:hypothetical protein